MIRDKFEAGLIINSGIVIHGGVYNDKNDNYDWVADWDGINPVIMSNSIIEQLDYESPDIERLSECSLRICQYRYDVFEVFTEYDITSFVVTELPSSESYKEKLSKWLNRS